jgi:hypothetical protein
MRPAPTLRLLLSVGILFVVASYVDVTELVHGAFSVRLNADDVLFVLCPGLQHHSTLFRLIAPARQNLRVLVLSSVLVVCAIKDLPIFSRALATNRMGPPDLSTR